MSIQTGLGLPSLGLLVALALPACSHAAAPPNAAPAASSADAPAATTPAIPDYVSAAVNAADRSVDDKALDGGRKPAQMLAFFGIQPGMKVAEIGAGGGYTSELLSRVVGPTGKVYAQN